LERFPASDSAFLPDREGNVEPEISRIQERDESAPERRRGDFVPVKTAFINQKSRFIPNRWRGKREAVSCRQKSMPMETTPSEPPITYSPQKGAGYRVANHQEAGHFNTMTEATIWALKNLNDWDWWIEPINLCFNHEIPHHYAV
jgi:hypothetical protein